MKIRLAAVKDIPILSLYDKHISKTELTHIIPLNRVYIAEEKGDFLGWLRYQLFWDNTPFLNMLYVLEKNRGKGYGKALLDHWERNMKVCEYPLVMTSTPSNEYSQHFYVKLGYRIIGGFLPEKEPFEVILSKRL